MSEGFIGQTKDFLDKNTQYTKNDVTGALSNISDDIYHTGQAPNSVFNLEDDTELSYDEFLEMMSDAAQMSVGDLNQKEMELLFNILNSSGDDDVLSYDELKILADGDEITDFSMWMAIACISEEDLETKSTGGEDDDDDTTVGSGSTTPSSNWEPKMTEDGKYDFTDPATSVWYIDTMREDGDKTPKDVADRLLKDGDITEEEYEKIKSSYYDLSDEQMRKVEAKMTQGGLTFEEAVKALGFDKENNFDEPFPIEEDDASKYADAMYDTMRGGGTEEVALRDILNNKNISDADFVDIMKKYLGYGTEGVGKGSLIQHIDSDFSAFSSGMTEQEAMEYVGEKLLNEAMNGNQDAIDIICLELMNGTAGMDGTAEHFVNYIFENASPEMLAKIIERYPEVNEGHTLADDIKGDFSFASGWLTDAHSQNWYLEKISKAINS